MGTGVGSGVCIAPGETVGGTGLVNTSSLSSSASSCVCALHVIQDEEDGDPV